MSSNYEKRVQNQFGGFCVRVLKNEAKNIHKEYARLRSREKSVEELSGDELSQLTVVDNYFAEEHIFSILDKDVVIVNSDLAEGSGKLPQNKRDVILLSYFIGMSDSEIGRRLNTLRQTISKRRTSTLKQLKQFLEKEGF